LGLECGDREGTGINEDSEEFYHQNVNPLLNLIYQCEMRTRILDGIILALLPFSFH
jgi:hypothetical protein